MHLGANVLLPEGLGHASRRALSAVHLSRPLPVHVRGLPRGAAGSDAQAGLRRALPAGGLQPDPAAVRAPVLQGLDRPGLPARDRDRDPAPDAVLRRQLRGQLRQQRSVRRRHRPGAAALHREEVPRARRRLVAVHVRRIDRRLGGDGGAGVLSRRLQRRLHRLSRIRSTSAPTPSSISTRTRTPTTWTTRGRRRRVRGCATISGTCRARSRR